MAPLRKAMQSLEAEIASLEQQVASRESEMADKSFFEQGGATAEKMREYETWKALLADRMERWEKTAAELEALGNG